MLPSPHFILGQAAPTAPGRLTPTLGVIERNIESMRRRLPYKCPQCSYVFNRVSKHTSGRTTCPHCHHSFPRQRGKLSETDPEWVKANNYAVRVATNRKLMKTEGAEVPQEAIRGLQVPLSSAEARFKAKAAAKGWTPHRPSWPDFLVETPEGILAVEVKSRNDAISAAQFSTFELLETLGVKVYLWRDAPGAEGKLSRWRGGSTAGLSGPLALRRGRGQHE